MIGISERSGLWMAGPEKPGCPPDPIQSHEPEAVPDDDVQKPEVLVRFMIELGTGWTDVWIRAPHRVSSSAEP